MRAWLSSWFSAKLHIPAEEIDVDRNIESYGLDSLQSATLADDLSTAVGCPIGVTTLAEHPTIASLARHLNVLRVVSAGLAQLSGEEQQALLARQGNHREESTNEGDIPEAHYDVNHFPEVIALQQRNAMLQALGVRSPFYSVHRGSSHTITSIEWRELINFSGNNYLDLAKHPEVKQAAQHAIEQYGTSVSASRSRISRSVVACGTISEYG